VVNYDQNDSVSSLGDAGDSESVRNEGGGTDGGAAEVIDADGYSRILGGAKDAAGLLEWKQQVLFRGMRVRMSVATGFVDNVRVHSMTKRREYTGDVLKKVQAVGEAPHGGQVGGKGSIWGAGGCETIWGDAACLVCCSWKRECRFYGMFLVWALQLTLM
jgi:hypothetical protein